MRPLSHWSNLPPLCAYVGRSDANAPSPESAVRGRLIEHDRGRIRELEMDNWVLRHETAYPSQAHIKIPR
ncbi:hypothetical protein GCM10010910_28700 [Microbacterium nanhaiense]|uniref:Uncharacterized protein n=1 Tax=Microbacterium nanhaiense TaxID=1301026 RepID=A0ABQ2N3N3_9MICO|nr:hypothetical protein GCM10010910_28700 [Microbacterium nanhaiense]